MKKVIPFFLSCLLAVAVLFTSCKKDDTNPVADNTDLAQHSDDQSRFSQEIDAVANDANTSIDNFVAFDGFVESTMGVICDATAVLDSADGKRRITITYNGQNCSGTRTRTGVVVLSMPLASRWKDAGAVLTVDVQQLKVTRILDGKSITINGTTTITNVSGGRLRDLATLGTIKHTISSTGMSITFDNGSQRVWQIAKERVFTYNNGVVITTNGTHTDGNITGISEWGTNRFGNEFVTSISTPMVIRQDCNFRLVSGQVTHQRLLATTVVTFGLDSAGNPVSCPSGNFYFKIVWTGTNGIVSTYILPY
ncbi:hypothetical protein [Ferruginibacter sp. HRS2-29]|uniref:hypothetical protein n=1 Tax=Ferruginibacter sp. HRS2-29 TaxID=2487334 RepID=UPI0020CC89BC|nr:hypothetical protein [Ferruginibacter sp. HRS2-29]MCP9751667.1 hypothetical protein [Ferruginibacter sp. HRS2-29]